MDCQRILKPISNCPNCGAPIKGPKCEYCDTIFDDSRIKEDINQLRWEIELRRAELIQAQFSQNYCFRDSYTECFSENRSPNPF